MPLVAQISTFQEARDERSAARRLLRLHVPVLSAGDAAEALVHNISERGLLLECSMLLQEGDLLVVDLPETGAATAEVIWARNGFAGCEFEKPVSKAAISAGLLKSPPEGPPYTITPTQPLGVSHDLSYEPGGETDEAPWMRVLLFVSLLLALIAAVMFISALLTAPLSMK